MSIAIRTTGGSSKLCASFRSTGENPVTEATVADLVASIIWMIGGTWTCVGETFEAPARRKKGFEKPNAKYALSFANDSDSADFFRLVFDFPHAKYAVKIRETTTVYATSNTIMTKKPPNDSFFWKTFSRKVEKPLWYYAETRYGSDRRSIFFGVSILRGNPLQEGVSFWDALSTTAFEKRDILIFTAVQATFELCAFEQDP